MLLTKISQTAIAFSLVTLVPILLELDKALVLGGHLGVIAAIIITGVFISMLIIMYYGCSAFVVKISYRKKAWKNHYYI